MAAPVLIIAIGNESRGDDALGPLLLRELDVWLNSGEGRCPQGVGRAVPVASATTATLREKGEVFVEQFELLEEFQLQIEHAMDMKDRKLVLFIDAGMDTPLPFSFYHAQMSNEPTLYSHALAPESLLKVYSEFYGQASPAAFVLCIRGESFELGEAPSADACANLLSALTFTKTLILEPEAGVWDKQCTKEITKATIRSAHVTN